MEKKFTFEKGIILVILFIVVVIIGLLIFNQLFLGRDSSSTSQNSSSTVEKYGDLLTYTKSTTCFEWNDGTYDELNLENKLFNSYDELEQYFNDLEEKIHQKIEFTKRDSVSVYQYFEDFDFEHDSLILWVENGNTKDFSYLHGVYLDDDNNFTVLIKKVLDSNLDYKEDVQSADVCLNFITLHGYTGGTVQFEYEEADEDTEKASERTRVLLKPIIYLYPKEDTEASVKLLKEDNLICSYPKYKNEWRVFAQPNGNLRDLTTGRELYSLYYESKDDISFEVEKEGFVVKGEDVSSFLEEKLSILGLSEREAEEFIVYWLPRLEANKYNYIRFATVDEINENMPIEIHPNPDTVIRILMTFKGLDHVILVQEQKLERVDRTGFVVVEWGGTEIK